MGNNKKVSVLIPCRNEISAIERCVQNVYDFAPPEGGFEVIVIDGMSNDGTRDILFRIKEQYPDLILIDNPEKIVPHAMNLGILKASGEYIVRADVRCIHPKSYLKDLIELSEHMKADNVGGVLIPLGTTYAQKSIALAYRSPIAMGGALRDRGNYIGETDAVYGGCVRRERLIEVGMYDETMVRNQDDELSFRLRKFGGKIIQSGNIKVKYFPRKHFHQLFKQFFQYGYWKVPVLKKHPGQASWRHLAPTALILSFLGLGISAIFSNFCLLGLLFFCGSYLLALFLESFRITHKNSIKLLPGVVTSIFFIHTSFGIGFIIGLISILFNIKFKWFETLSR